VNSSLTDILEAEIHRKALDNLTQEMATTLVRTSGSPIVYEAKDFSTCFFDTAPEQLGFSGYVLFHIASSLLGTQAIVELEGEDLRPGDGWLCNDPRSAGAMHQADVAVIMPMFFEDELLGWGFSNVHVLDVGGVGVSGYAPGAHDVYQEGLRFPPIRIIQDSKIDRQWERFIAANVRAPGPVLNDIRSTIAANNVGAQRLRTLVRELGLDRYRELCVVNKSLTEDLFRERITRIPDGEYASIDWNEFDGHEGPDQLLELRVKMTISGSDMRLDFSGVPQIDAFINSAPGAVAGQAMSAILTTLAYGDFPINAGLWRPVTIDCGPEGTIVNSTDPAPCSNAHSEVGMRVCKLVKDVLSQAVSLSDDPTLRARVAGQAQDGGLAVNLFGPNQHQGQSVIFYVDHFVGIGGGGQTFADGQDSYACTSMTGSGLQDVETHEALDPIHWLWRRVIPNSGGPGQFRGGLGMEQGFALRHVEQMAGAAFVEVAEAPPRGFGGGYPASTGGIANIVGTNLVELEEAGEQGDLDKLTGNRQLMRSKVGHMVVNRNDVQHWFSGGGGGLGDPLLRATQKVRQDVSDGYVTGRHAAEVYGVVTDGDTVDGPGTEQKRAEIRRERIGAEPTAPLKPPASVGVSVVQKDGDWRCGYCNASLRSAGSNNWRTAALCREQPLSEAYERYGMYVRTRLEAPGLLLREYFCSSCAGALSVDVATEGLEAYLAPVLTPSGEAVASGRHDLI
jgi:N-methylhydantoinase B